MLIIVDNGAYSLRNMGDVAMLQAALRHLRAGLPGAALLVLTHRPDLLRRYCPGAQPLAVGLRDCLYDPARPFRSEAEEDWCRAWPIPRAAGEFAAALDRARAVVVTGGGFLNDLNPAQTRPVLRLLAEAGRRGKAIALFSQGLGPLDNPELIGLFRRACQAGLRVGLREAVRGPEILKRAGASPGQYQVTGDDAIEMASRLEGEPRGQRLGISLRQAAYSGIGDPQLELLAGVVSRLKARLRVDALALPVSLNEGEGDHLVLGRLLGVPAAEPDTPEALLAATARCRVVLAGAYHAAVFALARGTPCVCFHAGPYYRDKLEGLARQFPGGCEVVDLLPPDPAQRLEEAVLRLWTAADDPNLQAALRESAAAQARAASRFYETCIRELAAAALPQGGHR